jgi:hypothetical protein
MNDDCDLSILFFSRLNCAKTWNSLLFSVPSNLNLSKMLLVQDGKTKEVLPKDATSSVRSISAVLDHEVAQKETSNKVELKGSPLGLKSQSCAAPSPVGMTTKNSKPSGNSQSKYMMTMPRTSATHSSYPPGYHPRQYGYHSGIRTSPLGYQHPSLYVSAYRQDMYHHQRQHHLQMGSPPTYSMPNGVYYPPPVQHNKTNTEPNSQRDGANSLPENDENAKPAPVKLEPTEEKPLETKTSPPIPSPPLKKRRIVGSWDEDQDRNENIGAASPGMFRSPLPGEKMQGGRNFFVSKIPHSFMSMCNNLFTILMHRRCNFFLSGL